jgi:hypothetical protein
MSSRIKLTSQNYITELEKAKLILKYEKILDKAAPIAAELEIMVEQGYIKIFTYVKDICLEFQWVEKEKELYFTHESRVTLEQTFQLDKPIYESPFSFVVSYLLHQDLGCHKFHSVYCAFEFIYMAVAIWKNQ